MDEMYGLMNYHHPHHQQATQPPDHASFDVDQHPREARDLQRVVPVLFGSGSNIQTTSNNINNNNNNNNGLAGHQDDDFSSANRAKIMSHPLYPKLLQAYISCQKVGAPPDIANLFDEIFRGNDFCRRSSACSCLGDDPELDEFMETYCEMLDRYRSDLARPFDEATTFLSNMHTQLTNLCKGASITYNTDESVERSEEDTSKGEAEVLKSNWASEDRALKDRLLRKYSKYISSLKHEFSNKKKKGKLPKEARQVLLDWWNVHYRWPYPTEADKIALAESTGLDQKQINNWFINQRKRHWKPSENMQFAVMDSLCGSFIVNN